MDSRQKKVDGRLRMVVVGGVQSHLSMTSDSGSATELGESSGGRYSSSTNANSAKDHYTPPILCTSQLNFIKLYINYSFFIEVTMKGFENC